MEAGTSTLKITGTDFICIPTQDFEQATKFYGETLGLPFSKQWGDMPAKEYETGTLTLAVWDPTAFGQKFAPHNDPIALRVEDVHAARAELESNGVKFEADTIDSGVCHMAFFLDPDGNALMFHNRYAPEGVKAKGE